MASVMGSSAAVFAPALSRSALRWRWVMLYASFLASSANTKNMPVLLGYLEADLHLTTTELGVAVGFQAMCHVLAVGLCGYCVTYVSSRMRLIAFCACAWALGTFMTSLCRNLVALEMSRVVLGLSSGAVGPVSQCLVAEWVKPADRGGAFGMVVAMDAVGQTLAASGVAWAARWFGSWRPALAMVGLLTGVFGMLAFASAKTEPPRPIPKTPFLTQLARLLRTPSLRVVITQGFFASTQVQATAFIDLWLQHCGYRPTEAAQFYSSMVVGNLMSCFIAGWASDIVAKRYPTYGRIAFGQIGDFCRIPALFGLLLAGPAGISQLTLFCCVLYGLTQSLSYVGAVKPLCAEAVPRSQVGTAIAIAATVDGAFAALAGCPLVGWLAESVFGFVKGEFSEQNMRALQRALGGILAMGTLGSLWCNTVLYWTIPADRKAALAAEPEAELEERLLQETAGPRAEPEEETDFFSAARPEQRERRQQQQEACAAEARRHVVTPPTASLVPAATAVYQAASAEQLSPAPAGATPEPEESADFFAAPQRKEWQQQQQPPVAVGARSRVPTPPTAELEGQATPPPMVLRPAAGAAKLHPTAATPPASDDCQEAEGEARLHTPPPRGSLAAAAAAPPAHQIVAATTGAREAGVQNITPEKTELRAEIRAEDGGLAKVAARLP